ncbi:MAG: hypothetical protein ABR559_03380 [Gemmatimonadota bacterium]
MEEIAPGVSTWRQYAERLGYDLNGFAWAVEGDVVAVDPPEPTADAAAWFERNPPTLIVVTNHTHWRSTAAVRALSGARVALSAIDAAAVPGLVDRVLRPGEILPGGWRVLDMAGKTAGELGLYRAGAPGTLLLGDSLIGDPPGALRLLPSAKLDDRDRLLVSLQQLRDLSYEVLLLGDGAPLLAGADGLVRTFLDLLAD